jgi:hypothetical protein
VLAERIFDTLDKGIAPVEILTADPSLETPVGSVVDVPVVLTEDIAVGALYKGSFSGFELIVLVFFL